VNEAIEVLTNEVAEEVTQEAVQNLAEQLTPTYTVRKMLELGKLAKTFIHVEDLNNKFSI
jgi:hypothetical protein